MSFESKRKKTTFSSIKSKIQVNIIQDQKEEKRPNLRTSEPQNLRTSEPQN
jgi:hypothetical protein